MNVLKIGTSVSPTIPNCTDTSGHNRKRQIECKTARALLRKSKATM